MTYTTKVLERSDLNRQIVRSGSCEISIPEFDLTLPPTGRGQLTTVEGLIRDIVADLSTDQPLRRIQDEDGYTKIEELLNKMKPILGDPDDDDVDETGAFKTVGQAAYLELPMPPFTLKLDDPAGNSFIEFVESMADPKWNMRTYHRTLEQNVSLGLVAADEEELDSQQKPANGDPITDDEVFTFPGVCSSCGHQIHTNMKKVNIPYFKVCRFNSSQQDLSHCELGHPHHVYELRILRLQRQRSQIWLCDISPGQADYSQM